LNRLLPLVAQGAKDAKKIKTENFFANLKPLRILNGFLRVLSERRERAVKDLFSQT
jgi:hypothetical protein